MIGHVEELQGQIHQATLQLDQILVACRDHGENFYLWLSCLLVLMAEKALEMVQDQQKIIEVSNKIVFCKG